jgi:hypothetical protein
MSPTYKEFKQIFRINGYNKFLSGFKCNLVAYPVIYMSLTLSFVLEEHFAWSAFKKTNVCH